MARRLVAAAGLVALAGCGVSEYLVTATAGESTSDGDTTADAPCTNGVREPWESDVDCGGPICEACAAGLACKVDADCASTICADGTCSDNPCDLAEPCPVVEAPCLSMACDPVDGCTLTQNPDGEPCETAADDPNTPSAAGTCLTGACVAACEGCELLDGPCRLGVCNPITGACAAEWSEAGTPCVDPQGLAGQCVEGVCETINVIEPFFTESFEAFEGDWTGDPPWQIAAAIGSMCSTQGIEDPGDDVSEGDGAGLAGLLIGECLPPEPLTKVCLHSPEIEAPLDLVILRYWEIVDLPVESIATVEFFDGDAWQELVVIEPMLPEWTEREVPLGISMSAVILLRFCVTSQQTRGTYSGWSVDEITLECPQCAP
ncbi:MAG: hypothetical protein R3A79_23250 [Nannocystaceae bacterium]